LLRRFLHVIASQRVGAKRRPMTGSAKQSGFLETKKKKAGLLRRCAPRNDGGKTTLQNYNNFAWSGG
jgi:hypothetical protein